MQLVADLRHGLRDEIASFMQDADFDSTTTDALGLPPDSGHEPGLIWVSTAIDPNDKIEIYEDLRQSNREGVVFKEVDAPFSPGRPSSGGTMLKFKFVESASFVVTGHNAKRSVTLGLYSSNGDKLVPAGNVTIPPNHKIPEVGKVCETRYLYAFPDSGSIYQPVYLGERTRPRRTPASHPAIRSRWKCA